jgi:hypothetical protein
MKGAAMSLAQLASFERFSDRMAPAAILSLGVVLALAMSMVGS